MLGSVRMSTLLGSLSSTIGLQGAGIDECDGATYHSARSARDRDRLRQEVLEGLGWNIHRIWSTDWFKHPERELKRLVEAIEKA
jgi:very-short-patch-repair endonuclease